MSRKPRNKRRWGLLGVPIAVPVLLAACSSSASSTANTGAAAADTATSSAVATVSNSATASSTPVGTSAVAAQIDSLAAQCVAEIKQASASPAPLATCSSVAEDNAAPNTSTGKAAGELCQKIKPKSAPAALDNFYEGRIGDADALGSPTTGPMLECSWKLRPDGSQSFYFAIVDIRELSPAEQASYDSGIQPGSVTQHFPDGSTGDLELGTLGNSADISNDWYYRGWPDHWEFQISMENGQTGNTIWTKAAPQICAELHSDVAS